MTTAAERLVVPAAPPPSAPPMLQVKSIYLEPRVREYARGREILARFPDATLIDVPSHWNIPGLHGNAGLVEDWVRVKRETLVLGVRKTLAARANGRSADWIAPGLATGCAMACAYCVETGTLISTPSGPVPVEQIQDGDAVLAFDSSSEQLVTAHVQGVASRVVEEVIELQVGDTVLRLTPDHPVLTRRGWVEAGHLSEDDEVLCDETSTG